MFLFEFATKLVIIGLIVTSLVVLIGDVMGLFSIIPNFSIIITKVFGFFTLMLTYVRFLLKLFIVPQWLVLAYVGLVIGIWGVNLTFRVIAFIKSIYDYIMQ